MRVARRLSALRARIQRGGVQVNILALASGTAAGQAVVILASPVITRLYTPTDFGLFGVYFFMFSVLLAINSLRYEFAIPLPEDDREAADLVGLSALLVVITTALFSLFIWFLADPLLLLANALALKPYLWLLPITLMLGGLFQILDYWAARKKRFSGVARARVSQSAGQVATQLAVGAAAPGPFGLLVAPIVGFSLSVWTLLRAAGITLRLVRLGRGRSLLMKYRNFALYTTWASLVDILGLQLPTVILAAYYAPQEAGYFAFTMRLLGTPAILLGQAVARVFYPEISERQNDPGRSRAFFEQVAGFLFAISAPVFTFVILFGPQLFGLIFGEQWRPAGRYAQLLAPWFLVAFVTSPLSTFSLVKSKQKQGLGFSVTVSGLRIGSMFLGAHLASAEVAAGVFSGVGVVVYLVYFAWLLGLAGSGLARWLGQHVGIMASVGGIAAVTAFALPYLHPLAAMLVAGGLLAGVGLMFILRQWRALSHV